MSAILNRVKPKQSAEDATSGITFEGVIQILELIYDILLRVQTNINTKNKQSGEDSPT